MSRGNGLQKLSKRIGGSPYDEGKTAAPHPTVLPSADPDTPPILQHLASHLEQIFNKPTRCQLEVDTQFLVSQAVRPDYELIGNLDIRDPGDNIAEIEDGFYCHVEETADKIIIREPEFEFLVDDARPWGAVEWEREVLLGLKRYADEIKKTLVLQMEEYRFDAENFKQRAPWLQGDLDSDSIKLTYKSE